MSMSISLPARLSGYGVHPVLLVSMENNQMISYRDVTFVLPANTIKGSWSEHGLINQLAVALGFTGEHSHEKLNAYIKALTDLGVQKVTVNDDGSTTYAYSDAHKAFPSTELNKLLKNQTNPSFALNAIYDELINEILQMPAKALHEAVQRIIKWMEEDHQKTLAFLKQLAKSLAKKKIEQKAQKQLVEDKLLVQRQLAIDLLKFIDPSFSDENLRIQDLIIVLNAKIEVQDWLDLTKLISKILDPSSSFDKVLNKTKTQNVQDILFDRYSLQRIGIK